MQIAHSFHAGVRARGVLAGSLYYCLFLDIPCGAHLTKLRFLTLRAPQVARVVFMLHVSGHVVFSVLGACKTPHLAISLSRCLAFSCDCV